MFTIQKFKFRTPTQYALINPNETEELEAANIKKEPQNPDAESKS